MTQFTQYPATAGIALMAIGVTIAKMAGKDVSALYMNVLAFEGEPWRILTSALPHGGVIHLLFNVIWLWIFGTALEQTWGAARTLAIFVVFELGAALAEYAFFHGGIGLSGIGYGLFGLLVILNRRDPRFIDTMDRRTIVLFVVWFFLCILFTAANVLPVGNVAHGVGAVMGLLLGLALAARKTITRVAAGLGLVAVLGGSLLGATIYRPVVNLSKYGGSDSAQLAYDLLGTERNAEAVHHLRRAIEIDPDDASSWYNLGLALRRMNKLEEALEANRTAVKLAPDDKQYRTAASNGAALLGDARADANDHKAAVAYYRESIAIEDDDSTWFNLSLAYSRLENAPAALVAAREAYKRNREADYGKRLANTLVAAGTAAKDRGDDTAALALFLESLGISYTVDAEWEVRAAFGLLTSDELDPGDPEPQ